MIAFLMENWETLGVAGILLMLGGWYFINQVRRQAKREDKREERDIAREDKVMDMVDTTLKNIEITTMKNKALNKQIVLTQERITTYMGSIEQAVRNTLEMSNGGNPFIKKILKRLDKIEKPLDK